MIDAATKVNDVLRRYPGAGEVFIQHGPLSVEQPGNFYLQFPDQTVGDYAQRNGANLRALLDQLNAVAAGVAVEPMGPQPQPTERGRPPEGPIGYTLSYRELSHSDIETEHLVAHLLQRGLD